MVDSDGAVVGVKPVTGRASMPEAGEQVGRYVIVGRLGAGAMGVVCSAYDPRLDRKVALKLLHPSRDASGTDGRQRLVREAKAMAKLSHPNVVAVHDAGEFHGGVFVAMEFIDGQTLRQWLDARPRSTAEVLEVFVDAAKGLAAAHEAELVHRDFKPENVMLAADGRARVLDFGLVRPLAEPPPARPTDAGDDDDDGHDHDDEGTTQTRAGAVMGTPAYMSPEQIQGITVDARSDQFSFCVALYEALYGERPFAGSSYETLATNVMLGEIRDPPRRASVPSWIRRVLLRGLSIDPRDRYASMDVLRLALAADPSRRRRRWLAVGGSALVLAGIVGIDAWSDAQQRARCVAQGQSIGETFGPSTREEIGQAMLAHSLPFAEDSWHNAEVHVERYLERWGRAREEVCVASQVEQRWTEARTAGALECLAQGRDAVASWVEIVRNPTVDTVIHADETAMLLPDVARCVETEHWPAEAATDLDEARALRREVTIAEVEWKSGRVEAGRTRLEAARDRAVELGDSATLATINDVLSSVLLNLGEHEASAAALRDSFMGWGRIDRPEAQRTLAARLAIVEADRLERVAIARDWLALANMLNTRIRDAPNPRANAQLQRAQSMLSVAEGALDAAAEQANAALTSALEAHEPAHPYVSAYRVGLAAIEQRRGNYRAALQLVEQQLESIRTRRGPRHPEVGRALINLATAHSTMGKLEQSLELAQQGRALLEASVGPTHPWTIAAQRVVATTLNKQGRSEEAVALLEQALRNSDDVQVRGTLGALLIGRNQPERAAQLLRGVYEQRVGALGDRHPDLVGLLVNLGAAYRGQGDDERGAWAYEEAIAVGKASLSDDHPIVSYALHNLGQIHLERDEPEQARPLLDQALAIRERKLGADHPMTASTLAALGSVALAEQRPAAAVPLFERARTILRERQAYPERQATVTLALGRALHQSGEDRPRAIALVQEAYGQLAALSPPPPELEQAAQWLRARGLKPAALTPDKEKPPG